MITAYDYPSAKMVEEAGIEIILVGDTLGMVVLGYESTIFVTLEDILHHTKAVTRGTNRCMVIADMPFLVAHKSSDEVLVAAGRLMQEAGAYGVKIEGCENVIENIKILTKAGIPVVGHLGLTPQSVNQLGGYYVQGKDLETAERIIQDAEALQDVGVFALVLECVPEELARIISHKLDIPVIGIGAGRFCDGQVLVLHDALGLSDWQPNFSKVFAEVGKTMQSGLRSYVKAIKDRKFPSSETAHHIEPTTLKRIERREMCHADN